MITKSFTLFILQVLLQIVFLQACSGHFEMQSTSLKPVTDSHNSAQSSCDPEQPKPCQVPHGSGSQLCNSDGSLMKCQILRCDAGFYLENDSCMENPATPPPPVSSPTTPPSPKPPVSSPEPPVNTTLKVVNMGVLASKNTASGPVIDYYWRRTDYLPQPNELRMWNFTTESLSQLQANGSLSSSGTYSIGHTTSVAILGTTPSYINPSIYISERPGSIAEFQNGTILRGCGRTGAETARLATIVSSNPEQTKVDLKTAGVSENAYCILKANTKYYVHTFSIDSQTGSRNGPAVNCSSPHCGYSFLAN